jgi:hypothetical protein
MSSCNRYYGLLTSLMIVAACLVGCEPGACEDTYVVALASDIDMVPANRHDAVSSAWLEEASWAVGFYPQIHNRLESAFDAATITPDTILVVPASVVWVTRLRREGDITTLLSARGGGVPGIASWDDALTIGGGAWQKVRWLSLSTAPESCPSELASLEWYDGPAYSEGVDIMGMLGHSPELRVLRLWPMYPWDPFELPSGMGVEALSLYRFDLSDPERSADLATWPRLTTLTLDHCVLSNEMIEQLSRCSSLQNLRLYNCDIPEGGIAALADIGSLAELIVIADVPDLPATFAAELATLSNLTRLVLHIGHGGADVYAAIGSLTDLEVLWLLDTGSPSDVIVAMLDQLPNLRSLVCEQTVFSAACPPAAILRSLESAERLEQLIIDTVGSPAGVPPIDDADAAYLAETFPELTDLRLLWNTASLTDHGLESISQLAKLRTLSVGRFSHFSETGLAALQSLPELRHLEIGGIDNMGMVQVGQLTQLASLAVAGPLDNMAVEDILKIEGLTYLDIEQTSITVDGVRMLVPLRMLRRLDALPGTRAIDVPDVIRSEFSPRMLIYNVGHPESW